MGLRNTSCPTKGVGVMITFLDATQDVGWGGGVMITFLELANLVDATQDVGGGFGDDRVP